MSRIELPESWNLCACANEPALARLRDVMRLANEKAPVSMAGNWRPEFDAWYDGYRKRQEELAPGPLWELMMHLIDRMGWGEHGSGINGSWLTAEGEEALRVLEGLPLDH